MISWINHPNLYGKEIPKFLLKNFPYGALIFNSEIKDINAINIHGYNIVS